jgi:hypothetical protein
MKLGDLEVLPIWDGRTVFADSRSFPEPTSGATPRHLPTRRTWPGRS